MIGPGVGSEFRGHKNVVDVNFKRRNSGEDDRFIGVLVKIEIGVEFDFRGLVEFVGDGVLDDDGAGDVPFDFLFHCIRRANYVS